MLYIMQNASIRDDRSPSPRPVAVSMVTLWEQLDQQNPNHESSYVRPESDAAGLRGLGDGRGCAAQELADSPVAEHEPSGHRKNEDGWEPDENAGPRIEHEISAHDRGNRAAGPDARHPRAGVEQDVGQAGGHSTQQVEDELGKVP